MPIEKPPSLCERVSALAWHSATVAWAYVLIASGLALDALPAVLDLLSTPEAATAVTSYTGPYASHVLKAFGIITWIVRFRSLRKGVAI